MRVHRCTLSACYVAFGLALLCPNITLATDLPIYGGLGGQESRAECPKGSYLVGLAGRTGSWVDRVAPVCAPWLRGSQAFGAPTIGKLFGMSGGGIERQASCMNSDGNRHAIQSWTIAVLKSDNHYVQHIWANCMALAPVGVKGSGEVYFEFGSSPSAPPGDEKISNERVTTGPVKTQWTKDQSCPNGEIAVGFRVRAGRFVDALGLICGPLPASLGAPVTKLPSPLVQAPSPAVTMNPQAKNMKIAADMFVITKPVPGQLIPHGKLIIVAIAPEAPPTVGTSRYAELELRCLEAPSNLQFSHPYFQVITVEEAKLRRGYAVDQGVTGACSGGWQVRARFSLNAPTGPWSAAVPFQLCFNHCPGTPPSPVQQTAPLPSSVIQAPLPSSAPAQMRRSPSMIVPRGVDEKGGEESNQTVDESTDAEKKP